MDVDLLDQRGPLHDLAGNERRYLDECVTTNFVSSVGPFVERFEQDALEVIGGMWKVIVVRELLTGTKRYSELHRGLRHATHKMLA